MEDSKLIWEILLTCIGKNEKLFEGSYEWFSYYVRKTSFESSILKALKSTSWLYINGNIAVPYKPGDIVLNELSKEYETSSPQARTLISNLNFKTEAEEVWIGQMPPEKRDRYNQFQLAEKLCDEKGIDLITALNEIITSVNREDEKKELEKAPDTTTVEAIEEEFKSIDYSNVEVREFDNDSDKNKNSEENGKDNTSKQTGNQMSQEMKNEIGNRGEKIVFDFLKKKWDKKATLVRKTENEMIYEDKDGIKFRITILNTDRKKGIGCDILIKNEETIYEYIEVKSSKLVKKELFPVNGYQWSLAQKVFKEGEGNKYFFYVVKDVLSEIPKVTPIKNPIKKWKDGELRAHPVNLEL